MKSKLTKNNWVYINKKAKEGKLLRYPIRHSGDPEFEGEFELRKEISKMSNSNFNIRDYDDAENAISDLNCVFDEKPYDIHMPFAEETCDWVIELENGISLWVQTEDEYYGGGEYSSGVSLEGFIFDNYDKDAILEAAKWLSKVF
ncbi:hypothetical protein PQS30_06105 [Bacillus licheniformis]|uniref:Uncharacterized protein n=3 Tax=Bacillus TaxID=1386 RepID=A0AB37GGN6_BACLI|nr:MULTISPECIES: hypothetical protein [Bacillus]ARC67954.1 hypothetical protein B34_00511 [Bacillus licheniformis]ASB89247.1 hypothetical protein S101395_02740 [Bacillus sonorensis]KKB71725.1 hypothetical protein TH62_21365 [Bacillus sp. TH008]MDE1421447.1 hypothetical protein [Bacillus licheniformis]MDI3411810.1 hypothetical protein [Bacillus sonorensis]